MNTDLSLAPTSELLEELVRRHDAVVLTGVKFTKNNGEYVTFRRFNGNNFLCNGLLSVVEGMIVKQEMKMTTVLDDNEDR